MVINKYFNFASTTIVDLGLKLLKLYEQLYQKISTTLWISDLHGDGERFIRVLQGRFGLLYTTCQEALQTSDDALIRKLTIIIRRKYWTKDLKISKQDALSYLLTIIRYKLADKIELSKSITEHDFTISLLKSSVAGRIPQLFMDHDELFDYAIKDISECILVSIPDKIIILGDIFDRGASPDKIIRILRFPYYRHKLSIIWGNHDVLWLGACAQNKSMVAEALRITFRYGHTAFLLRLGINTDKLSQFAIKTYPKTSGNFKAKNDYYRSIEKALAIIQFKLEEQTIIKNPEFKMKKRLWLKKLTKMLANKEFDQLTDTHFPTLNPDNPCQLTASEQAIIDDLTLQFQNNVRLKRLMELLIHEGSIYSTYNNLLNIHALIPSNADGQYEELFGYKGKDLLDYINTNISIIGNKYLEGQEQDPKYTDQLFYLWCGAKSPLFGKEAMKTFERYFLKDKNTHKEQTLYWNNNLNNKKFQKKLKKDFKIERIIFGHTPRDISKGDTMSMADGFAINIDGGFAGAYLERGHALVNTPYSLYGIVLPDNKQSNMTKNEHQAVPSLIEIIDKHPEPILFGDTKEARKLSSEETMLIEELKAIKKKAAENLFQYDDEL